MFLKSIKPRVSMIVGWSNVGARSIQLPYPVITCGCVPEVVPAVSASPELFVVILQRCGSTRYTKSVPFVEIVSACVMWLSVMTRKTSIMSMLIPWSIFLRMFTSRPMEHSPYRAVIAMKDLCDLMIRESKLGKIRGKMFENTQSAIFEHEDGNRKHRFSYRKFLRIFALSRAPCRCDRRQRTLKKPRNPLMGQPVRFPKMFYYDFQAAELAQ